MTEKNSSIPPPCHRLAPPLTPGHTEKADRPIMELESAPSPDIMFEQIPNGPPPFQRLVSPSRGTFGHAEIPYRHPEKPGQYADLPDHRTEIPYPLPEKSGQYAYPLDYRTEIPDRPTRKLVKARPPYSICVVEENLSAPRSHCQPEFPPNPAYTDIFIAVMGVTGSGKSSFISRCIGDSEVKVGHNLESCTKNVEVHSYMHSPTITVHLVDTPGFDDDKLSDVDILKEISSWLFASYQYNIRLNGLLYLHRITDPRMQGSARKNLTVFKSLCGLDALRQVTLVTTMWDKEVDHEQFENRETELLSNNDFWRKLVEQHGACVGRHDNTRKTALSLLERFIQQPESTVVTDLQRELVDDKQSLKDTAAGKVVMSEVNKATERVEKDLQYAREVLETLKTKSAMEKEAADKAERERKVEQARQAEQARAEQAALAERAATAEQALRAEQARAEQAAEAEKAARIKQAEWEERAARTEQARAEQAAEAEKAVRIKQAEWEERAAKEQQAKEKEQAEREEQAKRAEQALKEEQAARAELEADMAALEAKLKMLKEQEGKLKTVEVEKDSRKWDSFFKSIAVIARAVADAVIARFAS